MDDLRGGDDGPGWKNGVFEVLHDTLFHPLRGAGQGYLLFLRGFLAWAEAYSAMLCREMLHMSNTA